MSAERGGELRGRRARGDGQAQRGGGEEARSRGSIGEDGDDGVRRGVLRVVLRGLVSVNDFS